jgi:Carboxypeptidase regulatory-like domain
MGRCAVIRWLLIVGVMLTAAVTPARAQNPVTGVEPDARSTGRIAGRVTKGDTGQPVAGATVLLGARDVPSAARTATTNTQGRFEFRDLPAGRYSVTARQSGYLQTFYGDPLGLQRGSVVELSDGERFERADIALAKPGAIEGQVVDEFGDPAPDILVKAYQVQFAAGARRFVAVGGPQADPTDDRGQFRFFGLAPGTYYLCAQSGAFGTLPVVDESLAVPTPAGFAPTFFPGTTDASKSRGIAVTLASTTTGVTIRLVPARTGRVSGTIANADGSALQRGVVRLAMQDPTGASPLLATANIGRGGAFEFGGVPAGAYYVQGMGYTDSPGQPLFGYVALTTTGDDVAGLMVAVKAGVVAHGRVDFDGNGVQPPKPESVAIIAQPVGFDPAAGGSGTPIVPAQISPDWTFELRNLTGRRVIRPAFRSEGWFLARVLLDGVDVTDGPLDFTRGDVTGLEVVLTTRAASVSGTVVSSPGERVRDYTVVVFASDSARWTYPSRFLKVARSDREGRFEVKGLPPEEYLLAAVASVQGAEWQDPEFLERLRGDATRLLLTQGQSRAIELRLSATPDIR